ncbi:DUF4240 domain-containing protein [Lentzea flava]|uniref:DUF4240 domain-containing protein n=1 Tax=Lentzea flava TaxID=103732 RepID=A0ABQ2UCC8_9PSEU|nr:DUF4240 domain-containing protein [Lentzea flava]MCP2196891.1 Protein of unknown function (DUF4240) [Lentzea flava]GGU14734.1 hypothetical protein GCM10010178_02750 [Lentzea flava]
MDLNAFWALIERSAAETSDQDERLEWLAAALAPAQAVEFARRLDEVRRRVDTWAHWHAAHLICGGLCSDDGFFYFQAWLVGQGREVFEAVASSPDALADVPHVRFLAPHDLETWADADWPDWEGLDYVAAEAFGGDLDSALASLGVEVLVSPEPPGEQWDFADPAEISARIPRLGALFGKVGVA